MLLEKALNTLFIHCVIHCFHVFSVGDSLSLWNANILDVPAILWSESIVPIHLTVTASNGGTQNLTVPAGQLAIYTVNLYWSKDNTLK